MLKKTIMASFSIILAVITAPSFACREFSNSPRHVEINKAELLKNCDVINIKKKEKIKIENFKKLFDEDDQVKQKAKARFRVRSKSIMFIYKIDWP